MSKQWMKLAGILVIAFAMSSCSGGTEMSGVWRDPSYQAPPVNKVMVVGIGESESRKRIFEDIMSKAFVARKLQVVQGTQVLPADSMPLDQFKQLVKGTGAQLLTVSRLVGMDTETSYVPGTTYVGGGYGGYYYSAYSVVSTPGYTVQYKIYKVETNVFDVASEKMVWSGLSETTDPANMTEGVSSLSAVVVSQLAKDGIIK